MAHTSGKSNEDDPALKGLIKELDVINKRGKKTIESSKTFNDLGDSIKRDELFNIVKELYSFSKRALDHVKAKPVDENNVTTDPNQLSCLIRDQLTGILPEMLKAALAQHSEAPPNCCNKPTTSKHEHVSPTQSHTLELEKLVDDDDNDDAAKISANEWTTVVKKDVRGALKKVPVVKAVSSEKGSTKLHFNCKDDLDRAEEALKDKYKVTSKSEDRKKLNPKITISSLDPFIDSAATLIDEIMSKNESIAKLSDAGQELKVVFFDDKDRFAVLQVTCGIRDEIRKNGDKLCIGLERYHIKDRYHVIQCYHCQEFGHMSGSPFCKRKDEDPICFFCAGSHSSKDCQSKKSRKNSDIKCTNCCKSRNKNERNSSTSHKASDTLCPFYVREKERIMNRTAGSEDSKNEYLQKVREMKQKFGRV